MVQLRILMSLAVLGTIWGCTGSLETSVTEPEPTFPAGPNPPPSAFDINNLLADDQIFGGEAISESQVLAFLTVKGSALASYVDPTTQQSAAQIILQQSRSRAVNPLYMLARINTESGLIESGSAENIDSATGCGCPDGGGCDPALSGFAAQIDCAGLFMQEYFQELDTDGVTRAGWSVGQARDTGDPCLVTPANRATAALYTYTPWVGAYGEGCGTAMYGGSTLVALMYYQFWSEYSWGRDPQ